MNVAESTFFGSFFLYGLSLCITYGIIKEVGEMYEFERKTKRSCSSC